NDYRKYADWNETDVKSTNDNYIFPHAQIDTIINADNEYEVIVRSGDTLIIANRDPYVDCAVCGIYKNLRSAYPASENHRVYWIYWKRYQENEDKPLMLELNMPKILANFEKGKALKLTEEPNLAEQTLKSHNLFFQDFFFSIGRVEYQK
ncbi:MAG: hypothetical protein P8X47_13895, partial [Ignavibacteriaceae bacterium]